MADSTIFCPQCDNLLLEEPHCAVCGWERPTGGDEERVPAWERRLPGTIALPFVTLAIGLDHVFVPVEDERQSTTIYALSQKTGAIAWSFALPEGRAVRHLFLQDRRLILAPEDMRVLGEDSTTCIALDAAQGAILWETSLACHSLSPPVAADRDLLMIGSDCIAYFLSLDQGHVTRTVANLPPWVPMPPASAGSFFIVGGRSPRLVKLDPRRGDISTFFVAGEENHWFNLSLSVAGKSLFATNWNRQLYAFNLDTGRTLWRADLHRGASSPTTAGKWLYLGVKAGSVAGQGYALHAYDPANGNLVWAVSTGRHIWTPPLIAGDIVLASTGDGYLLATDANDGTLLWTVKLKEKQVGGPLLAGDLIITASHEGTVAAIPLNLGPSFAAGSTDPEALREASDWAAAGAIAALQGDLIKAAGDFSRAGSPGRAAQLFARAGRWEEAATHFMAAGRPEEALKAATRSGDRRRQAGILATIDRFEEAAHLYESLEEWEASAAAYEKAGLLARAADLYRKSGQPARAAPLYLALDEPEKGAHALHAAGQVSEAADLLQQAGDLRGAAALLEESGQFDQAAALHLQAGDDEEALRLYQQAHLTAPALDLALARHDWVLVRQLAFDLNRFELEAEACLQLAESVEGNARYDLFAAAGQALVRAARVLEEKAPDPAALDRAAREVIARLWVEAGAAFEKGLESYEMIQSCAQEARRLRRWPELTFQVGAAQELVADEFHTLVVIIENTGFGIARQIYLRVLEDYFDGDLDRTQHISGLRPGASTEIQLRVRPKANVAGSAVPLDLELSYLLPNEEPFTRTVRGQVPVRRRQQGAVAPPAADPPTADTATIGVYKDAPTGLFTIFPSAPPGLRQKMVEAITESELRDICFDLDIDFELLPGQHKGDKIRELIIFCEKRKKISALLDLCEQIYSQIDWRGKPAPGSA